MNKFSKIIKIVFFTVLAFLLIHLLFFQIRNTFMYKPEITFPAYQDGDTIPFLYDNSGRIITKVIIGVDTLEFMVDTGADVSIVPATYKNSDVMYKRLTDYLGRKITDASGITKRIYSVTIKKNEVG